MLREVKITTGSRLHWGLLSLAPEAGREFGGIGLMIDAPNWMISVKPAQTDQDQIQCSAACYGKVEAALQMIRKYSGAVKNLPAVNVKLESEVPLHSGFGSGTQLSLAVAHACLALAGETRPTSAELSPQLDRGARSALGLHGFDEGGFLVEGGKRHSEEISPLIARVDFPEDWKIVLVTPTDESGISGGVEAEAIQQLGPMPVSVTERLCRLVLMQLLPAVKSHNFSEFSTGLTAFGQTVGSFFQPAQGGIYAHPLMVDMEKQLIAAGVEGMVQTSWGPTVSIICSSSDHAEEVSSLIQEMGYGDFCAVRTVNPLNQGAEFQINPSA